MLRYLLPDSSPPTPTLEVEDVPPEEDGGNELRFEHTVAERERVLSMRVAHMTHVSKPDSVCSFLL